MIHVRLARLPDDTRERWQLLCPECRQWGWLSFDELWGIKAIQCICGFHERIDLAFAIANVRRTATTR